METDWEEIEDCENIKKQFLDYTDGLVRHKHTGLVLPPNTAKMMDIYKNMPVRENDIWVVTFPKCGTTWTQEMVWQIANNVDIDGGKKMLEERFPYLEAETLWDPKLFGFMKTIMFGFMDWTSSFDLKKPSSWFGYKNTVSKLEDMDKNTPRFIKSHLPLSFLPPSLTDTAKVIYVARNPKDAMISYYHHHKLFRGHNYVGDLPTFVDRFIKGQLMYDSYFYHVEEAWKYREKKNVLIIFFEEMKEDLRKVIDRVCKFLDVELTDDKVNILLEHLNIKNFKNNPAVNNEIWKSFGMAKQEGNFIRKGEVGGWKKELEMFPEAEEKLANWVQHKMSNSEVVFPK